MQGPVLQTSELADGDGIINVTVEPDAEASFALTLKCEDSKNEAHTTKTDYSFELQAVAKATRLANGK